MKKIFLPVFFWVGFVMFFCAMFSSTPTAADQSTDRALPVILIEPSQKLNLIGFIPPEKRTSYAFDTVSESSKIIDALLKNEAMLGFLSPIEYFQAKEKGVAITAVSSPFQCAPVAFAYKKNIFRRSFEDFRGKSVLYEPGSLGEVLFNAFLRRINIAPSEMVWIPLKHKTETDEYLRAEKNIKNYEMADIIILDSISEVILFAKNPDTERILFPYEFGINFKGPLMVASSKVLAEKPDEVAGLVREALEIFKTNIFDAKNIYTVLLQKTIPYVFKPEAVLGDVTQREWIEMQRILLEEGVLKKPITESELYSNLLVPDITKRHRFRVALPGLPSVDYAGFYVAEDSFYFRKDSIYLALDYYADEHAVIDAVRKDESLLGVASPLSILIAQAQEPDLKVVGVIYQQDPTVLIVLRDGAGKSPNLSSGNAAILTDEAGYSTFLMAVESGTVKPNQAHIEMGYPSLFELIDKRVQAVAGRGAFDDPRLEMYKNNFEILLPQGTPPVGLSIFTTSKNYDKYRKLIKSILKSAYHGYENSIYQPEKTADSVIDRDGTLSLRSVRQQLKTNASYFKTAQAPLGTISPDKWRGLIQFALDKKLIAKGVDLDTLILEETKSA